MHRLVSMFTPSARQKAEDARISVERLFDVYLTCVFIYGEQVMSRMAVEVSCMLMQSRSVLPLPLVCCFPYFLHLVECIFLIGVHFHFHAPFGVDVHTQCTAKGRG